MMAKNHLNVPMVKESLSTVCSEDITILEEIGRQIAVAVLYFSHVLLQFRWYLFFYNYYTYV